MAAAAAVREKKSVVVVDHKACGQDSCIVDADVVAKHRSYLVRLPPPPSATLQTWKDALIKGDATSVVPLSVKPSSTDYAQRVREYTVQFTVISDGSKKDAAELTARISADDCRVIFTGQRPCPRSCRHLLVPLSIAIKSYSIEGPHSGAFEVQLHTKWPNFTDGAKVLPKAWFATDTWEAVADTRDKDVRVAKLHRRLPRIGLSGPLHEYPKPPLVYTADPRIALPVNFDTLRLLYIAQSSTSSALEVFGARPVPGRTDVMALKQPDLKTNIAPSLLSLQYTSGFRVCNSGASEQTIDEHSFDKEGTKVGPKRTYWLCTTQKLRAMLHEIQQQQSSECLAMDVSDGLAMTFYPKERGGTAAAAAAAAGAGAGAGRCVVSVTVVITGVVV